jgi:hypothetical protein
MAGQPSGTTDDREYTSLVVTPDFRDKIRVAKAKQGQSYEEYLRQHLPIETED